MPNKPQFCPRRVGIGTASRDSHSAASRDSIAVSACSLGNFMNRFRFGFWHARADLRGDCAAPFIALRWPTAFSTTPKRAGAFAERSARAQRGLIRKEEELSVATGTAPRSF